MNPTQACKTTLAEMKPIMEKHPTNANLKRWCKRFISALAEAKKEGYSAQFEKWWNAYPRTKGTSKPQAYGNWCKLSPDDEMAEFLTLAVAQYGRDCKKGDISMTHPATWLSPTEKRWESYEGLRVKVQEQAMCKICKKDKPFFKKISVRVGKGVAMVGACHQCQKYDYMTKEEIEVDLTGKGNK